jgi:hypothetical protein
VLRAGGVSSFPSSSSSSSLAFLPFPSGNARAPFQRPDFVSPPAAVGPRASPLQPFPSAAAAAAASPTFAASSPAPQLAYQPYDQDAGTVFRRRDSMAAAAGDAALVPAPPLQLPAVGEAGASSSFSASSSVQAPSAVPAAERIAQALADCTGLCVQWAPPPAPASAAQYAASPRFTLPTATATPAGWLTRSAGIDTALSPTSLSQARELARQLAAACGGRSARVLQVTDYQLEDDQAWLTAGPSPASTSSSAAATSGGAISTADGGWVYRGAREGARLAGAAVSPPPPYAIDLTVGE